MQRSRQAVLVLAAVAVAAATAGAALPGERVLVVEDAETGEQYLTVPVADGATVALEYTHSVEQSRVYEAYTVRGDVLELTRMEFESYGWGLPAGADVTEENGTFVYDPPGNATRLTVAPGRVAGHELHVAGSTHDLVALTDAASVDVHLARRTPLTETIETIHG